MNENRDTCENVLVTLRKIIQAIDQHSRILEKQYGLTGPQLMILKELSGGDGRYVSEIAKRISLSQPTVTDILDRLEAREYVVRTRSADDKRRVMVKATDRTRTFMNKAPSLLQEQFVEEFNKLAGHEQQVILSSLTSIASMMNAHEIKASPVLVSGPLAAENGEKGG